MEIKLNQPLRPDLKALSKYLEDINQRGWFTNFGPLETELTSRLRDYLGVRNLLLVANGTVALEVAARTLGCQKVVTTPFSFAATASAFKWVGCELDFVDVDRSSFNLNPDAVVHHMNMTDFDSVLATHVFGNPCEVDDFSRLGKKIIYDAAHAFDVRLEEKSVLEHGDASTLSFHATKVFHTLEGGAIVFDQADDLEAARRLINFAEGQPGSRLIGINGKMSEYHAAVGLVLLEDIHSVIARRSELYDRYVSRLSNYVELQRWKEGATKNGAYMPVLLGDKCDVVEARLQSKGILSRRYFKPPLDELFDTDASTPYATEISRGVLCLPLHAYLEDAEVDKVCNEVIDCLQNS